MSGVRVVEMGLWVAGPACGGILSDWGADVVKIEPPGGDPFRSLDWLFPEGNPPFDLDNRGKRSVAVDVNTEDGVGLVHRLLEHADVFLTNYRPGFLERLGLDWDSLKDRYPRLVYASITGLGLRGAERDRQAYDVGAFWSRAGIAKALTPPGHSLPYQRGGMGDHMTGLSAAAGVSAALFHRERTGEAQRVETSLIRIGTYMLGWDHSITAATGEDVVPTDRQAPANPLINCYECSDGASFWMLCLEAERHWPDVVRCLDKQEWATDPRFATIEARLEHSAELVRLMDTEFRTRTRDEWGALFDRENVWWAPVQTSLELVRDPQAEAAGCFVDVPTGDGTTVKMAASPVDFSATPWEPAEPPPELGQHTELVLMELGVAWETIEQMKADGVIP